MIEKMRIKFYGLWANYKMRRKYEAGNDHHFVMIN